MMWGGPIEATPTREGAATRWHGQFTRFAVIGLLNTGVYYALFVALHVGLPYLVAHVLAFAGAIVGSFFLNCRYTFRIIPTLGRFIRFPLANVATFVVMTAGVGVLVEWLHLAPDLAAIISALGAVPVTFLASRFLLLGRARPSRR
jgi:putative flippase GtrA